MALEEAIFLYHLRQFLLIKKVELMEIPHKTATPINPLTKISCKPNSYTHTHTHTLSRLLRSCK